MDYYTELDMKRNLYNVSHNKKANKVIIGWKVEEYLIKIILFYLIFDGEIFNDRR